MTIRVFMQNEAGSSQKNYHDEKTLAFHHSRLVSHAYPFPYGFIVGTDAADGCNVDCFVITNQALSAGSIVVCEPVGLMEQFEDGIEDHNVLARLPGDAHEIDGTVEAALTEHALKCFTHILGKRMRIGRFLGAAEAETHVRSHLERGAA